MDLRTAHAQICPWKIRATNWILMRHFEKFKIALDPSRCNSDFPGMIFWTVRRCPKCRIVRLFPSWHSTLFSIVHKRSFWFLARHVSCRCAASDERETNPKKAALRMDIIFSSSFEICAVLRRRLLLVGSHPFVQRAHKGHVGA